MVFYLDLAKAKLPQNKIYKNNPKGDDQGYYLGDGWYNIKGLRRASH